MLCVSFVVLLFSSVARLLSSGLDCTRSLRHFVPQYKVLYKQFRTNHITSFFSPHNIMTSILKAQKANSSKAQANGNRKRKSDALYVNDDEPEVNESKKKKNKQRVLLLSSRGITHRMRHLMNDLEALLPHVKKGTCQVGRRGT